MNIFLTGPIRYGKSTLLGQIILESGSPVAGYFIQRLIAEGQTRAFHLVDISSEPYVPDLEVEDVNEYANIIGYIGERMSWHPEILENAGAQIIRQALSDQAPLLLMDELGRIELQAPGFQQAVFDALGSRQTVLGVIKPEHNAFLDAIRSRDDVVILDLNKITYQDALMELRNLIKAI